MGNNIQVGSPTDWATDKRIDFRSGANITSPADTNAIKVSAEWFKVADGYVYLGNQRFDANGKPTPQNTPYSVYSHYRFNAPWQSALSVGLASNQWLSPGVFTKITNWSPTNYAAGLNAYGEYDGTAKRFTVSEDSGTYMVAASLRFEGVPDGATVVLSVYRNGSEYLRLCQFQAGTASATVHATGSGILFLKPNDVIEVYGYSSAGGTVYTGEVCSFWKMWKMG